MKIAYLNFALLVLTLAVSFFCMLPFKVGSGSDTYGGNGMIDIFAPGMAYSFFIIWVTWSKEEDYPPLKLVLFFPVLVMLYLAAFFCGLLSWGVGVPVIGGIGALLIKRLFYWQQPLWNKTGKKFLGKDSLQLGFLSGLAGFLLFLWANVRDMQGVGFGCILVTWQAAFGIKWILQKNPLTP